MDETDRERLHTLARELSHLAKHASWQILRQEVERRMHRDMLRFASPATPDIREFDWKRGFWAGALYVLNLPEHAEDTLEVAIRRHEAQEQGS